MAFARWEGHWGEMGGKGKRIKKEKLVGTEESQGCDVQHRERGQ